MFTETLKSKRAIASLVFGIIFLLIGGIGFIKDPVFGLFEVHTIHNIVHIASGIFLVFYGSRNYFTAKKASLITGLIYALVTILGFLTIKDHGHLLGIMEMNMEDNFLHLFLSIILLGIGLV